MQVTRNLTDFENELLGNISKEQLMTFTKEIAKEVRLSGTEEELRAFKYAKDQLESFGIQTELVFSNGYISLPGDANLQISGENYECITHAMSKPVNNLEAEVIDVGSGSDKEFQESNVKGKVVVIDGLATPGTVKKAETYGAAGAIFVNAKHTHQMIVSPVWGTPVPETVSLLPEIPVLSVNNENGLSIRNQLANGENGCKISNEVDTRFRLIPTLTAEIKGSEDPDKFVLFSGHIDSWYYGVMDNGTANAVMLELARILSNHQGKLKRSLRFAFWSGHSHGRYAGSAWYCDTHWEDLAENCVLHVNVDSVGAKDANVLTEANCMNETKDLAKDVIGALTGEKFEGGRFGRAGDQSFWGTGTPSLFMGLSEQEPSNEPAAAAFGQLFGGGRSGGFGWWWHTTEDTLDKIDPDNLKRDCEIYLAIVYRALTDPIIPVNQLASVEEIEMGLRDWQTKANGHFDLSLSIDRVSKLKESAIKLQDLIKTIDYSDKEKVVLINETLMEISRVLVPLNYVKGDIFDHDLALKQPVIPKLSAIEELIKAEKDSNQYHFIYNSLVRKSNEVNYALKTAAKIIEQAIDEN
jgi:hypothetical protein